MLSDRHKRTGNMYDLEAAISKAKLAVSTTPEDHADRPRLIHNQGIMLSNRYKRMGNIQIK